MSVNGAEVHQQAERTPRKSLVVTVPVKLREGANAIVPGTDLVYGIGEQPPTLRSLSAALAARSRP